MRKSLAARGVLLGTCIIFGALASSAALAQPGVPSAASVKDKQVVKAAQFAVKAQQQVMKDAGKKEKLTLVKIVSAKKQVVSGMNYRLTLAVKVDGQLKTVEAIVWEQAWRKEPYKLTSWKFKDEASGAGAATPGKDEVSGKEATN